MYFQLNHIFKYLYAKSKLYFLVLNISNFSFNANNNSNNKP